MKNTILSAFVLMSVICCQKVEESITTVVTATKNKAEQKARETVQETVNEQLGKLVNAENVEFQQLFPHDNSLQIENVVGKKVAFPNGTPFYVFKYKVADKDVLLKTLVEEPTTDEGKSNKDFQKVDGRMIIEKITFFEKFLPANSIDMSFLDDIKNDKNIEYYKIKRFPNASTVIYNPKSQMVYQFVEVKK
ncbi:hypothetical protein [Kaistella palustris]|uniref:hypothetical protein n=1 Tax=Kaistella palustris TaxID=493376 RepID=UPI000416D091|nr:hypothetical protein [Kaistella palustris]